eukprot:9781949-Heterocapsa_arctica.AAC.1
MLPRTSVSGETLGRAYTAVVGRMASPASPARGHVASWVDQPRLHMCGAWACTGKGARLPHRWLAMG